MKHTIPKQFLPVSGTPLCLWSYKAFLETPEIKEIIVVCPEEYRQLFSPSKSKRVVFAYGGKRRQDSVFNGLAQVSPESSFTLVHDAARPCITSSKLKQLISEAMQYPASTWGVKSKNTLKKVDSKGLCLETINRDQIWEIQTPQMIKTELLKKAFTYVQEHEITVTDDVSLVEHLGIPVKIIEGQYENIKVTTPSDLKLAELYLQGL